MHLVESISSRRQATDLRCWRNSEECVAKHCLKVWEKGRRLESVRGTEREVYAFHKPENSKTLWIKVNAKLCGHYLWIPYHSLFAHLLFIRMPYPLEIFQGKWKPMVTALRFVCFFFFCSAKYNPFIAISQRTTSPRQGGRRIPQQPRVPPLPSPSPSHAAPAPQISGKPLPDSQNQALGCVRMASPGIFFFRGSLWAGRFLRDTRIFFFTKKMFLKKTFPGMGLIPNSACRWFLFWQNKNCEIRH